MLRLQPSRYIFIVSAAMLFLVAGLFISPSVKAESFEESFCTTSAEPYYDAVVENPANTYTVFVKMGKRGQSANVRLDIEATKSEQCSYVGSVPANGDTWQKIGQWQSYGEANRFQLTAGVFENLPDANRPTVMLVPTNNPPCTPTANCQTTIQGKPAFIEPTGTLLNENVLHVTRVIDPKNDKLLRIDYYSDGQFLYSKPTLENFDLRYVPGGEHTLSRVMQYASKQQVVLQETKYISFSKDFQNLIFRVLKSNSLWLKIVVTVFIIATLVLIGLGIIHALHRRHVWRISHGFEQIELDPNIPSSQIPPAHILRPESPLIIWTKRLTPFIGIFLGMLLMISLVDTYALQLFKVDGSSMEKTLQNGDLLMVNKLSKTKPTIAGQEFVPRRGQVIIFHKAKSDTFKRINPEETEDVYVVKRVIGLPGERVVLTNGQITVYNRESTAGFNPDKTGPWNKEYVPGANENIDVTLGTAEIFVSGDNRPGSTDSRFNGPIKVREIVGIVEARILPFAKRKTL